MIIRSFLLFVFLFQCGLSPLLAMNAQTYKSHLEKSSSKQKPTKSDVLEEDEDESEVENHFEFYPSKQLSCIRNYGQFAREINSIPSFSFYRASFRVPIIIWVHNFRI